MKLHVQNSAHILNRRVTLVPDYTSNETVNNLSMHDDSLNVQTGHHRLSTPTVQDVDPKP